MMDQISPNADAFAESLNQLGKQLEEDVFNKIVKKVLFDLWRTLIEENPKETGRSSASWMLATEWTDWQLPPGEYMAGIAANMGGVVGSLPKAEKYCLFNNVEYISALEDGHSKLAPSGFIVSALTALADHVRAAAVAAGYAA